MPYLCNDNSYLARRRMLRSNQTAEEAMLWNRLKGRGVKSCKFFRQYSVGPFIIDFYCPKERLAIELDGGHHRVVKNQRRDETRTEFLKKCGVRVLRFWNHQVRSDIESVIDAILDELGG